jgi:hypothetical protein
VKKRVGLWIDHRKAVIVIVTDEGEEIKEIASHMEKHVRFTGGTASELGSTEDMRDRQFGNHLNSYYDRVITALAGADSIQIFGPGEAKGELRKRLEHEGLEGHVLAVETADKMTDRQIAAKVREHPPT